MHSCNGKNMDDPTFLSPAVQIVYLFRRVPEYRVFGLRSVVVVIRLVDACSMERENTINDNLIYVHNWRVRTTRDDSHIGYKRHWTPVSVVGFLYGIRTIIRLYYRFEIRTDIVGTVLTTDDVHSNNTNISEPRTTFENRRGTWSKLEVSIVRFDSVAVVRIAWTHALRSADKTETQTFISESTKTGGVGQRSRRFAPDVQNGGNRDDDHSILKNNAQCYERSLFTEMVRVTTWVVAFTGAAETRLCRCIYKTMIRGCFRRRDNAAAAAAAVFFHSISTECISCPIVVGRIAS